MDNAISFLRLKGWHPLAAGPVNPGLLPRTGRSGRHRRWVPEKLGPGRQIDLRTARAASADSEVRPGPRPQTLRPYQAKTTEAGPEAQSTSSLPNICLRRPHGSLGCLRADHPVRARATAAPQEWQPLGVGDYGRDRDQSSGRGRGGHQAPPAFAGVAWPRVGVEQSAAAEQEPSAT